MTPERRRKLDHVLATRQPDLTILAESLHKPRNFSAVIRTCDAVGIYEVHVIPGETTPRRHWHTSQGAEKWVPVKQHDSVRAAFDHLRGKGFSLIAAHLSGAAVDFRDVDYTQPTALVLGTEKFGVSEASLQRVDRQITIPMMGMSQSLNVSVACALVLYEAQRQRMRAGMYDQSRLDPATRERVRFEWLHPVLSRFCRERGLDYPALDEQGELAEPLPGR